MTQNNTAAVENENSMETMLANDASAKPTDAAESAEATNGQTLQVQDLQNLLQIVDYAADQGAFKGWATMAQVFAVRQKLNAFLQAVAPKEAKEETKEEATASGESSLENEAAKAPKLNLDDNKGKKKKKK